MFKKAKFIVIPIIFLLVIQTAYVTKGLSESVIKLCDTTDDIYASNILDPDEINLESNTTAKNKAIDMAYVEYYGNSTTAFVNIYIIDLTHNFDESRDLPFWYYINFNGINFVTLKLKPNYTIENSYFETYIKDTDNWQITADRAIQLEIRLKIYSPDSVRIYFNNVDNKLTDSTEVQIITASNKSVAQGLYYGWEFCWDLLPNLDGFIYNVKNYCELQNMTDYFLIIFTIFPAIIIINQLVKRFRKPKNISI